MKAPTADYSPLSQALSAKSSAIQSGYAAKDASNWKSRYRIQQKSIDNSDKWNNAGLALNLMGSALNFASSVVNYNEQKQKLDQDNENLKLNQGWNLYGQEANTIIAKYGDKAFTTGTNVEYGPDGRQEKSYVQVNQEMAMELNDKFSEIFGSQEDWSEDSWNSIQNSRKMAYSALQESMWQNYAKTVSTQNANLFNNQYSGLMTEAVQTEGTSMMPFSYSDGNGGTTTGYVPKSIYNLINGLSSVPEVSKTNMLIAAEKEYNASRGEYLLSNLSDAFSSGAFMQDTGMVKAITDQMASHEEGIKDVTERRDYHDRARKVMTNAISTFTSNQLNTIADQGNDFNMVQNFLDEFEPEGQLYAMFYDSEGKLNPYVAEGTYGSAKASVQSVRDNLVKEYGSKQTGDVQAQIQALVADRTLTSNQFTARIDNILSPVYGDKWRTNNEAIDVMFNALKSLLPKDQDWTKDEGFQRAFQTALDNVFKTPGFVLAEADQEQYKAGIAVQDSIMNRLFSALVENPGLLRDPAALQDTMNQISNEFTYEFWDAISASLNSDDPFNKSKSWLFDHVGDGYMFDNLILSDEGYIEPDSRFTSGMQSQYREALVNVAKDLNTRPGVSIDIFSGTVQMVDGVPQYAVFNSTENPSMRVKFNLETGSISKDEVKVAPPSGDGTQTGTEGSTDIPQSQTTTAVATEDDNSEEILGSGMKPIDMLSECTTTNELSKVYDTLYKQNPEKAGRAFRKKYEELYQKLSKEEAVKSREEEQKVGDYLVPVGKMTGAELTQALGKRNENLIAELFRMSTEEMDDALAEINGNANYSSDERKLFKELITRLKNRKPTTEEDDEE